MDTIGFTLDTVDMLYEHFVGMGFNSHIVGGLSSGLWPEETKRLMYAQLIAPKGHSVVLGSHNTTAEGALALCKKYKKDDSNIFGVDLKFGEYSELCAIRSNNRCPEQPIIRWQMNSAEFGATYGDFTQETIGLVLIDSYHSFKHIISEFNSIKPYLMEGSIVLFHDNSDIYPKRGLPYNYESAIMDDSENFLCDEAMSYILDNNPDFEEIELPGPKCEHYQETGLTKWVRGTTSPFNALGVIRLKQSSCS